MSDETQPTPEIRTETPADAPPETPPEAAAETAAESPPAPIAEPEATDEESATEPAEDAPDEKAEKPEKEKPQRAKPKDPVVFRAFRSRRAIEGTVVGLVKGGYEVRMNKSRAFCPHSQISLTRVEDAESQIGQTHAFRVIQYRRAGDDVVVSRRALLEEERTEEAKAVRAALVEGGVVQGRVTGVADFGAFVDLGAGVMGLVHISELSHARVTQVADAVSVGDSLPVKIVKIAQESGKISLSAKKAVADPWSSAAEKYATGKVVPGKVVRLAAFGAFVEFEPGVEALAPAREIPPNPAGDWRDGLEPGVERDWLVLSLDRRRRRISIIPSIGDAEAMRALAEEELEAGAIVKGRVQKVERFGVFVWLRPGKVGMVPNVWSGVPRGSRMEQTYPVGSDVEVEVVDITEDGKRIRLAKPGVERVEREAPRSRAEAKRELREINKQQEEDGAFGMNLGDKLRAALNGND